MVGLECAGMCTQVRSSADGKACVTWSVSQDTRSKSALLLALQHKLFASFSIGWLCVLLPRCREEHTLAHLARYQLEIVASGITKCIKGSLRQAWMLKSCCDGPELHLGRILDRPCLVSLNPEDMALANVLPSYSQALKGSPTPTLMHLFGSSYLELQLLGCSLPHVTMERGQAYL